MYSRGLDSERRTLNGSSPLQAPFQRHTAGRSSVMMAYRPALPRAMLLEGSPRAHPSRNKKCSDLRFLSFTNRRSSVCEAQETEVRNGGRHTNGKRLFFAALVLLWGYTRRREGMDVAERRLETLRAVGSYSWVPSVTQWLPAFQRTGAARVSALRGSNSVSGFTAVRAVFSAVRAFRAGLR
ncbi:unnamed protein product [Boreogadus saida]